MYAFQDCTVSRCAILPFLLDAFISNTCMDGGCCIAVCFSLGCMGIGPACRKALVVPAALHGRPVPPLKASLQDDD